MSHNALTDIVPADPDLPRQRKSVAGGLFFTFLSLFVFFFALGALPAVDALFADLGATLRSHNDVIVKTILDVFPLALVAFSVFGLTYMLLGRLNRQRRAA